MTKPKGVADLPAPISAFDLALPRPLVTRGATLLHRLLEAERDVAALVFARSPELLWVFPAYGNARAAGGRSLPPRPNLDLTSIPEELTRRNRWVCWDWNQTNRYDGTWGKCPISPRTGDVIRTTADLVGLQSAVQFREQTDVAGIGYMFDLDDGLVVLDLDGCINAKTGNVVGWADELVQAANSYTEVSPSGTGLHVVLKGASIRTRTPRCSHYPGSYPLPGITSRRHQQQSMNPPRAFAICSFSSHTGWRGATTGGTNFLAETSTPSSRSQLPRATSFG